jgi:hypothetical protein
MRDFDRTHPWSCRMRGIPQDVLEQTTHDLALFQLHPEGELRLIPRLAKIDLLNLIDGWSKTIPAALLAGLRRHAPGHLLPHYR